MPLRDDLLNPIPGDNPSGISLRYERVYDQIKEARTEDDESIPAGEWQRQSKRADFQLVIKLAGEALATRSKDLQLAAWLCEAHVKREGIALVAPCLKLFQDLQDQFWETLYPEIDEGDVGMRAVPIEWAANRVATVLRETAITRDGRTFYQYKDSRAVGYEADIEDNDAKREARALAIADGKCTGEDFDTSFSSTSKAWYAQMDEHFRAAAEVVDAFQRDCEEKYGDDSPGFGKLRTAIEEVGQVVTSLLREKRKIEPDEVAEEPAEEMARSLEEPAIEPSYATDESAVANVPVTKPRVGKTQGAEPADREDALSRVQACARFFQKDNPASPIAYLLQAALRLGEMREQGNWPSYDFLVPPPTEKRQALKRLSAESNWEELLAAAIDIAGEPCGRSWLDVHRYIWKAGYEGGYTNVANAVVSTLQSTLKDIPELPTWTLSDDTPTANPETQRWLEETVIPAPPESAPVEPAPEPSYYAPPEPSSSGEDEPPDVMDAARALIARGQVGGAIQLLMRDAAQQPSGRARFQRRLQIAQLCVGAGQSRVAFPVLEELVKEIDLRRLEEWEAVELLAPPLALLLQCLDGSASDETREAIFARLCRIDPVAAMDVSR